VRYADDCMSSMEVYGNIFYGDSMASSVFMMGGGSNHKIYNNLIIDCGSAIVFDSRPFSDNLDTLKARLYNIPFASEPWASRYPELAAVDDETYVLNLPLGNIIEKNALINTPDATIAPVAERKGTIRNNKHYSKSYDVGFIDKEGRNFSLKPRSRIFADIPGFKAIPFDKIGLYIDSYRKSLSIYSLPLPSTMREID